MLESIRKLLSAWEEVGISYCHWKSSDHLDATMEGDTDADILIDPSGWVLVESIAVKQGFRRLATVPLRSYPGIHDFVALDVTGKWAHIHLHFQLVIGDRWVKAYRIPIEEHILARRLWSEKYVSWVINPADELLLFCIRMSLKFKSPFSRERVRKELAYIREKVLENGTDRLELPESLKSLVKLYESTMNDFNKIAFLNTLSTKVRREAAYFRRMGSLSFWLYSRIRQVYRYKIEYSRRYRFDANSGRRALPTGGKIIAFVGIDGSGKSSAIGRMRKFFSIQLNVCDVFLGNGKSGAAWYRKIILAILGTKAQTKKHRAIRADQDDHKLKKMPWYYLLWVAICLTDRKNQLRKALKAKANGSLVLSDRWPQTEVNGTLDGPRLDGIAKGGYLTDKVIKREKSFFALAHFCTPDLVIRFCVSPEVAMTRKPGELESILANRHVKLFDSMRWQGIPCIDIDANRPIEEVDILLKQAIWHITCSDISWQR